MKKLFSICFLLGSIIASAQCSIQTVVVDTACYCDGSAQAINPVGTPPFQYQWNFGDTTALTSNALCSGNHYVVTMTDSTGCIATDTVLALGSVMVTSHAVTNTTCFSCCDGTDTAHAVLVALNCGPILYQWYPGPGFATTDSVMTGLCQGTYTVIVSNQCGCMQAYTCFISSAGPNNIHENCDPASCEILVGDELITVHSSVPLQYAEFYDLTGKLVASITVSSTEAIVDRPSSTAALILKVGNTESQWTQFVPPRK